MSKKDIFVREKELLLDYLKANDYHLYSRNNYMTHYYWIHKDYNNIKEYKKEYPKTPYNVQGNTLRIVGDGDYSSDKIKRKYLLDKWNNESYKDKEIFKEMSYLLTDQEPDCVLNFIISIPIETNTKLKLIDNLPVSVLDAYYVSFDKLYNLVNESSYSELEKDNFYLRFFKARKNQIKGQTGEAAEVFLLKLYSSNKEKLEPYFNFFPNINNQFNEIELNIEESGYVVFSSRFNMRKAGKLLGGISESLVQEWTKNFSSAFAKNETLWSVMDEVDKNKAIFEVRFYKNEEKTQVNESFTLENYKKTLKEFLIYMSSLTEKPKLNFDYINKWILQNKLMQKLESKEIENQVKVKKNKI